jgi:hypothetical protein
MRAQSTISDFMAAVFAELRLLASDASISTLYIYGPKDDAANSVPPGLWWQPGEEKWGPGRRFGQAGQPSSLWTREIPIHVLVFGGENARDQADSNDQDDPSADAGTFIRETDATEALVELLVNAFHRQASQFSYEITGGGWGQAARTGIGLAFDMQVTLRLPLVRIDPNTVTLGAFRTRVVFANAGHRDDVWTAKGAIPSARALHAAVPLLTGGALMAGGQTASGDDHLADAAIYSPTTGLWTAVGSMHGAREGHVMVRLTSGKVLVAGGADADDNVKTTETFDPATGLFTETGAMTVARYDLAGVLLPTGLVLLSGGYQADVDGAVAVSSQDLFDPAVGTCNAAGAMTVARAEHTATVLSSFDATTGAWTPIDGAGVLLAGGIDAAGNVLATAEVRDPTTGICTAVGSMNQPRFGHRAVPLPNGDVLIIGGASDATTYLATAEIYERLTQRFVAIGSMSVARFYPAACSLDDGRVCITGGWTAPDSATTRVDIFDPSTVTFASVARMATARAAHTATPLAGGGVLVTGGVSATSADVLASSELFSPEDPT